MSGVIGKTDIVDVIIASGLARACGQIDVRIDVIGRVVVIVIGYWMVGLPTFGVQLLSQPAMSKVLPK